MLDTLNDEICMLLIEYAENEEALDSIDEVRDGFDIKEDE